MSSPNRLKSKFPIQRGVSGTQLSTFDAESKSAKILNSLHSRWGSWNQLPIFDAESKSTKILNSLYIWGGGVFRTQLPTFDAESKSAKIPNSQYIGGGGSRTQLLTLILSPNSLYGGGGVGDGLGLGGSHFQLLVQSKSAKISNSLYSGAVGVSGVELGGQLLVLTSGENFGWLKIFDKNFFHPVRVSASQTASCGD